MTRRLLSRQPLYVRALRRSLEPFPRLYCAARARREPRSEVVEAHSSLVIEGYQGSGNTFMRLALQAANPGIRTASHLHSAAHVRRALQLNVPVVVIVRDPVAAIASFLSRFPVVDLRQALHDYATFYERLLRDVDRLVVVSFDEARDDFASVVKRINDRFGVSFAYPDLADRAAWDRMTELWEQYCEDLSMPTDITPPSADGEDAAARNARLRSELVTPPYATRLVRARQAGAALLAASARSR
jgi:hypothetical protein